MLLSRAVVALGANLGDPAATFARALELIGREIGTFVARSAWRETTTTSGSQSIAP